MLLVPPVRKLIVCFQRPRYILRKLRVHVLRRRRIQQVDTMCGSVQINIVDQLIHRAIPLHRLAVIKTAIRRSKWHMADVQKWLRRCQQAANTRVLNTLQRRLLQGGPNSLGSKLPSNVHSSIGIRKNVGGMGVRNFERSCYKQVNIDVLPI
jgi:hypothetical protein